MYPNGTATVTTRFTTSWWQRNDNHRLMSNPGAWNVEVVRSLIGDMLATFKLVRCLQLATTPATMFLPGIQQRNNIRRW